MSVKMKWADYLFYGSLILISILVFAIPYGLSPILVPDSSAYLAGTLSQGIVPVYPLFISLNKLIFSQAYYLQVIVIEQVLFAVCVTVYFVLFIRKAMGAGRGETYLFLLLVLIPYTVLMPDGMTSRFIVTEALAYPFFYLLMASVLKGIWGNKFSSVIIAEVLAISMALTRTQLQLVLVIPVGAFFLLWMRGKVRNEKMRRLPRAVTGILLSSVIFLLSYGIYRQSNLALQRVLVWTMSAADVSTETQEEVEADAGGDEKKDAIMAEATVESSPAESSQNIASQFSTVIFIKVMIMAERDDADLFQDAGMRQLYTYVYDRLEQEQLVFGAMDKNLLIADQLQAGLDKISRVMSQYLNDFVIEYPNSEVNTSRAVSEFSTVLLKAHPFRWLISGVLQLPFGLISSVFIHRRNIYWVSYLMTALIYGSAIGLCIMRKKDVRQKEFMVLCIGVNLLFVVATSMVFVSQKRYVNYGFGVFYISLYFMIKGYIVDLIQKRQKVKKGC